MICVRDLEKTFHGAKGEVRALRGVSFEVGKGQLFTLLGPSGCGKTTTLRRVAGLEQPLAGEISVNDRSVLACPMGHSFRRNSAASAWFFNPTRSGLT